MCNAFRVLAKEFTINRESANALTDFLVPWSLWQVFVCLGVWLGNVGPGLTEPGIGKLPG